MGTTEIEAALNLISTVKTKEDDEVLRVYMEYQSLYLTDLHRVFQPLARAYSYLNVTGPVRGRMASRGRAYEAILGRGRGPGYMTRYPPLRVETLETGHSIILICKGAVALIVALAGIAKEVFGAAEKYWKMKKAKDARENPPRATRYRSGLGRGQAAKELKELANYVEKTTRITEFHLQLDGLTWMHTKTTTSQLESSQE